MGTRFSPGCEARAAMAFTYAGVSYARGDRFPYRALGIIELDLRGLWGAGRVEFTAQPCEPSDAELERLTAPKAPPATPAKPTQPRR
jgi:hypothetical protein